MKQSELESLWAACEETIARMLVRTVGAKQQRKNTFAILDAAMAGAILGGASPEQLQLVFQWSVQKMAELKRNLWDRMPNDWRSPNPELN